ncbi:uncharacterized protein LOC141613991 [Silene latifolia]|uniref:uncharacterized protein LOC141613991 n=1 Tax=Silene latifolia TaxID=37657 RepID=UPI003D785697
MLTALKFPPQMIKLILVCVSSPWFTLSLNGSCFGYFQGQKGIRQGDHMSPLLFTICMEYLSRVLTVVTEKMEFNYHPLCRAMKLSHLCFADDLLMFCRGDIWSIRVILKAFDTFSNASGFEMNYDKSNIHFNGICSTEVDNILRMSGFKEGQLPFKYLGIPISYKRRAIGDCSRLVEKVVAKLRGWGAKKNYLWSASEQFGKTPAVSWESVCSDKRYGGLGIVNSRQWNLAMIGKFTWWLASKSDHLWIKWVDHVYMKSTNWFNVPIHSFIAWMCVKQRLLTKDRLLNFGMIIDGRCELCSSADETHAHLFYQCPFSVRCWCLLQKWLDIQLPGQDIIGWCVNWRCRSLLKTQVLFAAVVALLYIIWQSRNLCRLEHWVRTPTEVIKEVKLLIQQRLQSRRWPSKFQLLIHGLCL